MFQGYPGQTSPVRTSLGPNAFQTVIISLLFILGSYGSSSLLPTRGCCSTFCCPALLWCYTIIRCSAFCVPTSSGSTSHCKTRGSSKFCRSTFRWSTSSRSILCWIASCLTSHGSSIRHYSILCWTIGLISERRK